jgi:hypothetical protein
MANPDRRLEPRGRPRSGASQMLVSSSVVKDTRRRWEICRTAFSSDVPSQSHPVAIDDGARGSIQ